MKFPKASLAIALPLVLGVGLVPSAGAASQPVDSVSAASVTTADIQDSSASQQRWISSPGSRITLNPGNPAKSGPTVPLATEYFSWGAESYQDPQLKLFRADEASPSSSTGSGTVVNGFREDFADLTTNSWQNESTTSQLVDLGGGNKGIKVTTAAGVEYGNVYSKKITVDLSVYPMLTVSVPELGGGGMSYWALKIWPDGGGDRTVQSDTNQSGTFDYDLSELDQTKSLTGTQTFQIRLFVTKSDKVNTREATFDYLQFWGTGDDGTSGGAHQTGWVDPLDATTQALWSTSNDQGHGFGYQGTANGGVLTRSSSATDTWGAVARTLTVDLDRYPSLSITVGATTGKWNIAIYEGSVEKVKLQPSDSTSTGTFTFDVASLTGWSGSRTFAVRLYHSGDTGTSTTFTNLSFFGQQQWLSPAASASTTWQPEAIDYTAAFADGDTFSGFDTTVGVDGFGRVIRPKIAHGRVGALGKYNGDAAYDATTGRLSVVTASGSSSYAWTVQFPAGTELYFFASESSAQKGKNASTNSKPGGGFWAATMDASADFAIGFGFAMLNSPDASERARALAASAVTAADSATVSALQNARAGWTRHYDDFLAQVPAPQDFDLHGIDSKNVTATDVKRAYYTAWVGLEANIMEPTPETQDPGDDFWQIATGKPSTYASGPRGAEASAEWDSLFGIQFMAYIRPEVAWSAFKGNLKHAVPEPGTSHETLPSRKAQTAWILYEVTGEKTELASVYDRLVEYLDWASRDENMQWSYTSGGKAERDAEFYVSMIVDLGYAAKISAELGRSADADRWAQTAATLTQTYQSLFFPSGKDPLYKHWIANDQGWPVQADQTEPIQYVLTGLHTPGLGESYVNRLKALFTSNFSADKALAGLTGPGNKDIKAPDIQFVTYGLLDQGLATEAEQTIQIMNRDIIRAGVFAEVYGVNGDGSVWGGSVAPSIFGNIHLIDNVWMANGYRMDQGDPAIVRLPSATGGITGLQNRGRSVDLDLAGNTAQLSGPAVDAGTVPSQVDVSVAGKTSTLAPTAKFSDAALSTLQIDGRLVSGFTADKVTYDVTLPAGTTSIPQLSAETSNPAAQVTITQVGALPGSATVVVTAPDAVTTRTYTIAFTVATTPAQTVTSRISAPRRVTTTFAAGASVRVKVTRSDAAVAAGRVEVRRGSTILASKTLVGGAATLTLPKTLTVGEHSASIVYVPSEASVRAPVPAALTVMVTKARAKLASAAVIKPKKSTKRIKRGKAAIVRVWLSGVGVTAPTGSVRLVVGKRTLGNVKVKRSGARAVATIRLSAKLTKKLKNNAKVKVSYGGDHIYLKASYSSKIRVH